LRSFALSTICAGLTASSPDSEKTVHVSFAAERAQMREAGSVPTVAAPSRARLNPASFATVVPVDVENLNVGDIVLCKVNGFQYLHLIKAIQGKSFQIGKNRGRINGWIGENEVCEDRVISAPPCRQGVSTLYELRHRRC
jgi:hypothetical protein